MSRCGVKTFCYNWMPSDDWTRTSTEDLQGSGALSTSFNIKDAPAEVSGHKMQAKVTSESELWATLEEFLNEIVPVCEECNINLALHPDDPPVKELANRQRKLSTILSRSKKFATWFLLLEMGCVLPRNICISWD